MNDTGCLNLAYYDASDGPRLVIFGPLTGCFEQMQVLFRSLSQFGGPVYVDRLPFIRTFGAIELRAFRVDSEANECVKGLHRMRAVNHQMAFEWGRSAEGWTYLAELLDDLVLSTSPGHQYLSSYPADDAIIVVSKGEYGDEIATLI